MYLLIILQTESVKTQIIAHENEVYDIAFGNSKDIFSTVSADGSVRLFDLRALDHSNILYECNTPIVRLSWNKQDPTYIAVILQDSNQTIIIDSRSPTKPVFELNGHSSPVNCVSWAPHSACHICTAGDDYKSLIWNLARPTHPMDPILAYNANGPIENLQWSCSHPDFIAIGYSQKVQVLKV